MLGRMMLALVGAISMLTTAGAVQAQQAASPVIAAAQCEGLAGGRFTNVPSAPTWIIRATHRPATKDRIAHCEIDGYINPTVGIGMYLPAEGWNGKYIVRGCGGSCGTVSVEFACSRHLRDGYACIHTDMGHRSSQIDNNWVANNLQGQVDFGYRATHVTTVAGKAIAEAYYGAKPRRSYFFACSTGGRQAMIEAQRFPNDFDGVVAIAPVNIGPLGGSDYVPPEQMNRDAQGRRVLTELQIPLLYRAVQAACDANDGVRDGLVHPGDCKFDPAALQCRTASADPRSCLTPEQVDIVRRFYQRAADPGSELNWINTFTRPPGPPVEFAQSRGDPSIVETFNNAGNPDLSLFKARGGKLILTHGTTDLIVLPVQTTAYYETATRTMGGPASTLDFFRYFVIPGMDHCSGGDGAWAVDYIKAIDDWVEHGKAPDKLIGVKPKAGVELDYFGLDTRLLKPDQIEFSRPYYPYPQRAYYDGKGDPNLASSFRPGLRPTGRVAKVNAGDAPARTPQDLSQRLGVQIVATENVYKSTGLPAKNISDRIAKAMRRTIYQTDLAPAEISRVLAGLRAAQPSALALPAIESVQAEYPST